MSGFRVDAQDDFQQVHLAAEKLYKSIGQVFCPYFKEKIAFNARGLRHLKFKSDRQARANADQYARMKLISLAPEIIKQSHTLQGIWRIKRFENQKTNSRWECVLKEVVFYEFIAVLKNVRIKVIIKEVIGGKKHFWSVIPFWGIDKTNSRRILHSGNPEND